MPRAVTSGREAHIIHSERLVEKKAHNGTVLANVEVTKEYGMPKTAFEQATSTPASPSNGKHMRTELATEEGVIKDGQCNYMISSWREKGREVRCKNPAYSNGMCGRHQHTIEKETRGQQAVVAKYKRIGEAKRVSPIVALTTMLHEAAGNVDYYRQEVSRLERLVIAGRKEREEVAKLVVLYNEERDRLERYTLDAVRVRLDERQVRLYEAQAQALSSVIKAIIDGIGLMGEQRQRALQIAASQMSLFALREDNEWQGPLQEAKKLGPTSAKDRDWDDEPTPTDDSLNGGKTLRVIDMVPEEEEKEDEEIKEEDLLLVSDEEIEEDNKNSRPSSNTNSRPSPKRVAGGETESGSIPPRNFPPSSIDNRNLPATPHIKDLETEATPVEPEVMILAPEEADRMGTALHAIAASVPPYIKEGGDEKTGVEQSPIVPGERAQMAAPRALTKDEADALARLLGGRKVSEAGTKKRRSGRGRGRPRKYGI